MHNPLFVHVRECRCDLMNVVPDLSFFEENVLLNALLYEQLEVALFCPFDGNKEFIKLVVDEPVQVLDNIWVV